MLIYILKSFFPGGFFASDDVIDPGDVFGDFGVDSWFPCSSATITPTNDTVEKTHFVTHTCQWPARVSLDRHTQIRSYITRDCEIFISYTFNIMPHRYK